MKSVLFFTLFSVVSTYSLNRSRCRVDRNGNSSVGCPARDGTFEERNFNGSYKRPDDYYLDEGDWEIFPYSEYDSWNQNAPNYMPMNMNMASRQMPSGQNIAQSQNIDIQIQGTNGMVDTSSDATSPDSMITNGNSEVIMMPINSSPSANERVGTASVKTPVQIASAQVIQPLDSEEQTIQLLNDLALNNANQGSVVQGTIPLRESITVTGAETQTVILQAQESTGAVILETAPVQISSANMRNSVPVRASSAQQRVPVVVASAPVVLEEIQYVPTGAMNGPVVNPVVIASNPQVDYVAAFLSGTIFEGQAKWYDNWLTVPGSCNYDLSNRGNMFIGLPLRLMPLSRDPNVFYTPNNALCGKCALVTNVKTGASVKVLVVDTAYDDGYNVVLSAPAFTQIGNPEAGVLDVTYAQTAC
jgi:hypothetical protein